MTDLSRNIAFNRNLPRHLVELSQVLKRDVWREHLMNLEETGMLLKRLKAQRRSSGRRFTIPSCEKEGTRFRRLIEALQAAAAGQVYLWTPLAKDCGLPCPIEMSEVKWAFSFDVSPEGLMEIVTQDARDRLLLDFSLDERGERQLEVELDGDRWGAARY